jgi:hypothetical protein
VKTHITGADEALLLEALDEYRRDAIREIRLRSEVRCTLDACGASTSSSTGADNFPFIQFNSGYNTVRKNAVQRNC